MEKKYAIRDYMMGEEIKNFRNQNHMTRKQLASFISVSEKTIERWEYENAKIKGPAILLLTILVEDPGRLTYYEIPEQEYPVRMWYMYQNQKCTLIEVNDQKQLVKIRNYTKWPQYRAFGNNSEPSYSDYQEFLESRCFPRTRDKMKLVLRELGLPFYDPFMIIQKTEGRMAEDDFWLKLEN